MLYFPDLIIQSLLDSNFVGSLIFEGSIFSDYLLFVHETSKNKCSIRIFLTSIFMLLNAVSRQFFRPESEEAEGGSFDMAN